MFFMCFYSKKVRVLLAVECKFWKSRTAPVTTEQLHVICDHSVTTWRDLPILVLYPSNECGPSPLHTTSREGHRSCDAAVFLTSPSPPQKRVGGVLSVTAPGPALPYVNAPTRYIPGPACWVNVHTCCVSAPAPAPCGRPQPL
jgi:hypothetical protein